MWTKDIPNPFNPQTTYKYHGNETWAVRPFIDAFEIVHQQEAFGVNSRRVGGLRVEIDAAIIVPSQYVGILSGDFPDDGMAAVDACKAAAEQHVVGIGLAEGFMDGSEIQFGDQAEKIRLDRFLFIRAVWKLFKRKDN